MNCHEFEKLINDLACDNLMTVNQRAQAWTHKENCGRCAARLAEERLLTERLRLVARLDTEQAPPRVKAAVMAAFAQRAATDDSPWLATAKRSLEANSSTATSAPIARPSPSRSRWIWAATAAVILLAALTSLRFLNSQSPVEVAPNAPQIMAEGPTTPEPARQNPTPATTDPAPEQKKAANSVATATPLSKESQAKLGTVADGVKNHSHLQMAQSHKSRGAAQNLIAASANEVVTDYVPLTYLSTATALDSGLVVRVQVSRSTLISMGLPMNVESSKDLVKADVVVGDDGVARAIRLVHDVTGGKQANDRD
jgi:hypothetical protein